MLATEVAYGKLFLFKMLNHELDTALDPEAYDLSLPNLSLGSFNTIVTLKPLLKTGVYGRNVFQYNRMNLADLQEISIVRNSENTLHDLIPRLNEIELFHVDDKSPLKFLQDMNLPFIGTSEILNKPLPPFGSSSQTFITMVARPNSYVFTGQVSIKLLKE